MRARLRIAVLCLGIVELLVGLFLMWERHQGGVVACPVGGSGCTTVQHSRWAVFLGIPVSTLGVIGALALIGAALWRRSEAALVAFAIAAVGAGFSLYLTWLEANRIHAYCAWCLASMTIWIICAGLTGVAAWRATSAAPTP